MNKYYVGITFKKSIKDECMAEVEVIDIKQYLVIYADNPDAAKLKANGVFAQRFDMKPEGATFKVVKVEN